MLHHHPPSFRAFAQDVQIQAPLRTRVTYAYRQPEPDSVAGLLDAARLSEPEKQATHTLAASLTGRLRKRGISSGREGVVQGLLQEFALSSQEGIALMCLAEALLRIPDAATRDALIRDTIGDGDWHSHLGQSASLFVNAATWGLMLTGKLVATHSERGLGNALSRLLGRSGEPIVRKGVDMAMRLMGEQFVAGETIAQALVSARPREEQGFRYSYDMLGEAAVAEADAQRYFASYADAIQAIGAASNGRGTQFIGRGIHDGPGISIKLSALHPRYSRSQRASVMAALYLRLLELTRLARHYDIGLNIDAEEADRLDLSLDLLERLCVEPAFERWNGIGFVIQAYQKRCTYVVDVLIDMAQRTHRRLMVRLVKGAYWDSEIKRAQVDGLEGYPVYTRKAYTDVSYLACARKLLEAPAAIYPQFATHNAHTLAAIYTMAGPNYRAGQYEFQCLHGMGEPLYEEVVASIPQGGFGRPCRIYAPVGTHQTLLPYLVRRLLENGANTSFVNRIADHSVPIAALIEDPVKIVEHIAIETGVLGAPHPAIPLPRALFGAVRANSAGLDLTNEQNLASLAAALVASPSTWLAAPMIGNSERVTTTSRPVSSPADRRVMVGEVYEASSREVADAIEIAQGAVLSWRTTPVDRRATALERAADFMEGQREQFIGLMMHEAGKTFANAVGEVREAVDFLRYYAAQARTELACGSQQALGMVVCISPWNFPLSIFTGQIAAALAAGNVVLAKPAEQTPLIAAQAVRLLREGGIPPEALQLLPGAGETVGAALVADVRVRGVLFTGSNAVARLLQRSLAGRLDGEGRLPVLIAETGGENAMIVDSSALTEQVVTDVVASAFDSTGQRCSALRVLCIQEDVADRTLEMLRGAMRELRVGPTDRLATDVGPVIDPDALRIIDEHINLMRRSGRRVYQPPLDENDETIRHGSFLPPTLIELERIIDLKEEIFGPVLHVVRFRRENLGQVIDAINATGYGLTLGLHTRIDETIEFVIARARAGNVYVNRNMVGAVVGVQPFGGEGLSGTGPKAGGPLYLHRLVTRTSLSDSLRANPETTMSVTTRSEKPGAGLSVEAHTATLSSSLLASAEEEVIHDDAMGAYETNARLGALKRLRDWLMGQDEHRILMEVCDALARITPSGRSQTLPGPTGERNTYTLLPREAVLCIADNRSDLLLQFAFVLAVGSRVVWLNDSLSTALRDALPVNLRARITVDNALRSSFDSALIHADDEDVRQWSIRLAQRDGAIVGLQSARKGACAADTFSLERLLVERTLSVNTAAAGGNASLMTIG